MPREGAKDPPQKEAASQGGCSPLPLQLGGCGRRDMARAVLEARMPRQGLGNNGWGLIYTINKEQFPEFQDVCGARWA